MLVDTASQYGVGSIVSRRLVQFAPIGYGTFGFLDGALTALTLVAGYCVLSGRGRLPAARLVASALGVAVIALSSTATTRSERCRRRARCASGSPWW